MSDSNNFDKIEFNFKIWLSSKEGKGIMGDGKWKILKAIEKYGSLKAATEALGITYRRTWGDLKKIENDLGIKLLEKSRGGRDGGTTVLTPEGQDLVNAFDIFHNKVDDFIEKAFTEFRKNLTES
jgi:molybdate transport system regulatory protein